ncbi:MAG: GNAT family N-acetyltransferase [Dehalococcoidia bacterium]
MAEVDIRDVRQDGVEDLCRVCVPADRSDDPDWIRGVQEKKEWAADMLQRWGSLAKVAYKDGTPVGLIQYKPVPEERIVCIDCIYVPPGRCLRKGVASRLLATLMQDVSRTMAWFDNRPPLALVVNTFEGGAHDQYTAREFFKRKGFRQVGDDPDHLYYPLKEGFLYAPADKKEDGYIAQDDDRGKVLLVCGPNGCPATYPFFLKKMEKYVRKSHPDVPIVWLDAAEEPEAVMRRRVNVGDCTVNARRIETCVLDRDGFESEVTTALSE